MEKENKTLSEKVKTAQANGDNILSHMFYYDDVEQAVKEAYEEIANYNKEIVKIFKDKFGFEE